MKHARGRSSHNEEHLLDPARLDELEQSFRQWAREPKRPETRASRDRILLIFLLIRYTGAKLGEVLGLRPGTDIDPVRRAITFRAGPVEDAQAREAQISEKFAAELAASLPRLQEQEGDGRLFTVDPAFVRRKFYERAEACGFAKELGGPEMIRKARAVELVRGNLPLPAVQRLLGHSNPNLTTSFMSFPGEDMDRAIRRHVERESGHMTSARNSFPGKVGRLVSDGLQTLVELACPDGGMLRAMITNASAERMDLAVGRPVTAEIKAPWLLLERCDRRGLGSADNVREGTIAHTAEGGLNTECVVRLPDGAELCAILSSIAFAGLRLGVGDPVRVLFNCYAVVLRVE